MAGNYFEDPRPFYGLGPHNLVPLDEVFYGKRDPFFMYQMPSYGPYDDHHYRSRSVDHRRPEPYTQSYDYPYEYTNFQHQMPHPNKGDNQKSHFGVGGNNNNNHGGGGHKNHGGGHNTNHAGGHNNHGGGNNQGGKQKKQQPKYGSDEESGSDDDDNHHGSHQKKGNKNKGGHDNNHGNHGNNKGNHGHIKSWNDNRGFPRRHHRRRQSLTKVLLKKLGLRDDSSSDSSSDDERYKKKGSKGHGFKSDHKPYTVRFDDQPSFGGHKKHPGVHGLGEDHGPHGNNKGHGGGHPQGILKKGKNGNDHGYSSEDENRGHKNGGGKDGGGKKGGQGKLGRSQSMDFRVNLCCENCERNVIKSLMYMKDVDDVQCDQMNNKVMVMGNAKPESVLKNLRKVKKDTHVWQHHK